MDFYRTARFYQIASENILDAFENALDENDNKLAEVIRDEFLNEHDSLEHLAKRKPNYLEEDPKIGDIVFIKSTNRFVRVISISKDKELAVVKDSMGAYPVKYTDLRRVR